MNQETEQGESRMPAASPPGGSTGNQAGSQTSDLKSLLVQGLYAILFLIILIAALQLYFSVQQFISTWFSDEFIPVFNTLYYLAVVVGGIYLIFAYIRRR